MKRPGGVPTIVGDLEPAPLPDKTAVQTARPKAGLRWIVQELTLEWASLTPNGNGKSLVVPISERVGKAALAS